MFETHDMASAMTELPVADTGTLLRTPRGIALSTASSRAMQAVHRFEETVLDYGCDGAVILDAVAADPECAVAHTLVAAAQLFKSTRAGVSAAKASLAAARTSRADTPSERLLIASVAHWADDDLRAAATVLERLLVEQPRHLFAAKLLHYLQLATGNVAGMLKVADRAVMHHAHDARAHAMHAFALDQNGQHAAAERAAHRALEIAPDPWAHHAIAHAMDATGRYAEGRDWMHRHADAWSGCSSFLFTHNWWHAALFHIAVGDHHGATALYDTHVWTRRKDYCQDQINAISLLARLELAGADAGDRWHDVAARVADRAGDAVDPFLDLHYAYALAKGAQTAASETLLTTLEARARQSDDPQHRAVWQAAVGIHAFCHRDYATAIAGLTAARPRFNAIGGSSVQRQLFDQTLAAAQREYRN